MRLIATLQDDRQALLLSNYLKSQNIDNECEITVSSDWGNEQYGIPICRIWIKDEDHLSSALEIAREFSENSANPKFQAQAPGFLAGFNKKPQGEKIEEGPHSAWREESMGPFTLLLLTVCCLVFFLINVNPFLPDEALKKAQFLPAISVYYSPIEKKLLYDYPKYFELADQLIEKIENEQITDMQSLPSNLVPLYSQMQKTSYWKGYYERIVALLMPASAPSSEMKAPQFEKIRQGEWWRLISPAFVHANLLHLFFNMIWLILLGKQLEQRLGWLRFLAFVFISAVITNTAQYLMGGFNFVGFSGVICAMIAFVWLRQRKAPWEGYLLQTSTINFALLFLVSFLVLQMISFYSEIAYQQPIAAGIANTAHMAGLVLGAILANFDLFAWKHE